MVSTIPGSEILTSTLNMISQSLQIPVIIFLVIFAVFAVLAIGGLISEYTSRKKITPDMIEQLIYSISNANSLEEIKNIIENSNIYNSQKVVLIKILRSSSLTVDSRHALAKKLIEFEENNFAKKIEKTDVVTRIGPTLGLMGTLIPMGPGLAALGAGDVNTLANAIIVAFDTTVVGIGAGDSFWDSIVSGGYWWILYGTLITMIPVGITFVVARALCHLNFYQICGLVSGSCTNPPVLAFAQGMYGSDYASVNYATVYPLSMFLRVLVAQLLILIAMA